MTGKGKQNKSNTHNTQSNSTGPHYETEVNRIQEVVGTEWTKEDILRVFLEEAGKNVETTVEYIMTGVSKKQGESWQTIPTQKEKEKEKAEQKQKAKQNRNRGGAGGKPKFHNNHKEFNPHKSEPSQLSQQPPAQSPVQQPSQEAPQPTQPSETSEPEKETHTEPVWPKVESKPVETKPAPVATPVAPVSIAAPSTVQEQPEVSAPSVQTTAPVAQPTRTNKTTSVTAPKPVPTQKWKARESAPATVAEPQPVAQPQPQVPQTTVQTTETKPVQEHHQPAPKSFQTQPAPVEKPAQTQAPQPAATQPTHAHPMYANSPVLLPHGRAMDSHLDFNFGTLNLNNHEYEQTPASQPQQTQPQQTEANKGHINSELEPNVASHMGQQMHPFNPYLPHNPYPHMYYYDMPYLYDQQGAGYGRETDSSKFARGQPAQPNYMNKFPQTGQEANAQTGGNTATGATGNPANSQIPYNAYGMYPPYYLPSTYSPQFQYSRPPHFVRLPNFPANTAYTAPPTNGTESYQDVSQFGYFTGPVDNSKTQSVNGQPSGQSNAKQQTQQQAYYMQYGTAPYPSGNYMQPPYPRPQ